jgi:outer membrane protein OmpA-like peptidoglycan-associated protein
VSSNNPFKKWILPTIVSVTVVAGLVYYSLHQSTPSSTSENKNTSEQTTNSTSENTSGTESIGKDSLKKNATKKLQEGKYQGQIVKNILKENADCTTPIVVTDSVVFSPHTPKGTGNEMEISNNQADDPMYFENEHNTVWYKYSAQETGQLTFDIIPVDINDDYDFMLFKFDGGDFRSKVVSKKIKPIRTCISRNDKKIKSMTGLSPNGSLESYIHSGEGSSYVKCINVQKGETYYLLVDNVYSNGNGHTIRFHLKTFNPGDLFVGLQINLDHVTFIDSEDQFQPGSGYQKSLDSLYHLLVKNPNIKIEIQGHVNTSGSVGPGSKFTPQQLSEMRAKAVSDYLIKKGIDPGRLVTRGYAGTRPIIAHPKTVKEFTMNIRAEIVILSLDYKKGE